MGKASLDFALRGQQHRGASSILMQLVRSVKGLRSGSNQPTGATFRRKFIEVRDTPLLYEHLGGVGRELKRWTGRHLPCAIGSSGSRLGGSLYGLEDCSRILWDKPHTALTLAEQVILAASAKFHIILAPEDNKDGQCLAQVYWEKLDSGSSPAHA